MNFAIEIIAFGNPPYLSKLLKYYSSIEEISEILVLTGTKPWKNQDKEWDNKVPEIISSLELDNVRCIQADFPSEARQRNFGLMQLAEYDYVFIIDCDEFITKEHIQKVINDMDIRVGTVQCPIIDYINDIYHEIKRDHHPVIVVDPKAAIFYEHRCITTSKQMTNSDDKNKLCVHHLGYVIPKEELENKVKHHSEPFNQVLDNKDKIIPIVPIKELEDFINA